MDDSNDYHLSIIRHVNNFYSKLFCSTIYLYTVLKVIEGAVSELGESYFAYQHDFIVESES